MPIKSTNNIWTIGVSVVITAIITGGGVYMWQQSNLKSMERKLKLQVFQITSQQNQATLNTVWTQGGNDQLAQQLQSLQRSVDNMNEILYRDNEPYTKKGDSNSIYCTQQPKTTDSGRDIYPTDIEKYGHIGFLGELFTADDCGQERLFKLFGVRHIDTTVYDLGPDIGLINNPTTAFISVLREIGFEPGSTCKDISSLTECKHWTLKKVVPLQEILKLRPYAKQIESSGCLNCG